MPRKITHVRDLEPSKPGSYVVVTVAGGDSYYRVDTREGVDWWELPHFIEVGVKRAADLEAALKRWRTQNYYRKLLEKRANIRSPT